MFKDVGSTPVNVTHTKPSHIFSNLQKYDINPVEVPSGTSAKSPGVISRQFFTWKCHYEGLKATLDEIVGVAPSADEGEAEKYPLVVSVILLVASLFFLGLSIAYGDAPRARCAVRAHFPHITIEEVHAPREWKQ